MSRLQFALEGSLKQIMAQDLLDAKTAVTSGVKEATNGLKQALRAPTSATLGRRMGNTWRGKVYPAGKKSTGAAGFVWSKAPKLMSLFTQDTTVRAKNKKFLAIPTEHVPRTSRTGRASSGKRPIAPAEWDEASMGELKLVTRRGKPAFLVAELVSRKSRGSFKFKKATDKQRARGKRLTTVIMYILVPAVRIKRKVDLERIANEWGFKVADLIVKNWPHSQLRQADRNLARRRARGD